MAPAERRDPVTAGDPLPDMGECLGRTCLSWQADGELSPTDVTLILERLCLVDQQACQALMDQR